MLRSHETSSKGVYEDNMHHHDIMKTTAEAIKNSVNYQMISEASPRNKILIVM